MASENETISDIVNEMRTLGRLDEKSTDKIPRTLQALGLRTYADRIEAVHLREVAELERKVSELRECLKEAVTEVCNRLEKCGFKEPCVFKTCYVQKWRKALKGSSND